MFRCRKLIAGIISALLLLLAGLILSVSAGGLKDFPDGTSETVLPSTEGLTGLDSLRAWVDSVYYQLQDKIRPSLAADTKVIYGEDDRLDVYQVSDSNLLELAQACCVVVSAGEISYNGDGTYTLYTETWTTQWGYPLCPGEPFVGQELLGWCSGFLVGDDIIATAGHCVDNGNCGDVAFVFGYQQIDELTGPLTVVSEDNVYFCSEIINQVLAGDLDHSVLRLDRPVVDRTPVEIRRSGLVPNDDSLVVVGHPTGLPMKIAGGAVVQDNRGSSPWFQSNLDTYGGNSGSMVVNIGTWVVEGILVRGATDFVINGTCVESNRVPNTGAGGGTPFEEISKTISFASSVPPLVEPAGVVYVSSAVYSCADSIGIELRDLNLAGNGTQAILVTCAADSENVLLNEMPPGSAVFTGYIETETGAAVLDDGRLQVFHDDTVRVIYEDADDGTGSPATVEKSGYVDCQAPVISDVAVTDVRSTTVTVTFSTDEPANGGGEVGADCASFPNTSQGGTATSHEITVGGLVPLTAYKLRVLATDAAGNAASDNNGGECYSFTTAERADYFTQQFAAGHDIVGGTLELMPDGSTDFYEACYRTASEYPTDPGGGMTLYLGDDEGAEVSLTGGNQVWVYGAGYSSVNVCSNGFVTLGVTDTYYLESILDHFEYGPRVSAYWDDLNPSAGGHITYKQLSDRLVITWDNVPEFNTTNNNSFQLEMFFGGKITITHVNLDSDDGLVGISEGLGLPADFLMSDLSAYAECPEAGCCVGAVGNVDADPTQIVDIGDLTRLLDHLFLSQDSLVCHDEGNIDLDPAGVIDIGDVTLLIRHLFIDLLPLGPCP